MRILVIEDSRYLAKTIKDELKFDYAVDISFKGQEGQEFALLNHYDLIMS